MALALEWRFSKDQILELYLNRVYFGGGAYGIDAASRRFFGHSATELSVGEAAIIAGLVKAPSNYSPTADVDAAREPRRVALDLMVENGAISPGRGRRRRSRRRPARPSHPAPEQHPLFHRLGAAPARHADRRDRAAARRLDDDRPQHAARRRSPRSTPMRRAARRAPWSRSTATARSGRWSAAATMSSSSYNRATQANRQPGSSFKLFVYLAALEAGYRPDTIVQDAPITINGWTPRNDNGRHVGPIPLRDRLRLFGQHGRGPPRPAGRHPRGRRHGAALRHHHADRHQSEHGAGLVRGAADRHDPGLCLGRARRRRGDALRHPPGDDRRRHLALPAPGRRAAGAGRALGRGADDRIAPGRGRARHRPRRRSSAGRPRARPARPRRTRTAGSSAFRAGSPPASGWAATTIARLPGLAGGRAPARAFHDFMVRAVANRPVEQFATDVDRRPTGRSTRATTRSGSPRPTTSPWSTPTAIRSSPAPAAATTSRGAAPDEATQPEDEGLQPDDEDDRGRGRRPRRPPTPPRDSRRGLTLARPDAVEGGAFALQPGAGRAWGRRRAGPRPKRGNRGRD